MIPKLISNFTLRPIGFRGVFNSQDFNSIMGEILADLTTLTINWNTYIVPILDSLPNGNTSIPIEKRSTTIDPLVNGLDGTQIYLDSTSTTLTDAGLFYDNTVGRPKTIKEGILFVYNDLFTKISEIEGKLEQIDLDIGLSNEQKVRIGENIFDDTLTSNPFSLDGLTSSNYQNILQLAADIFNQGKNIGSSPSYALTGKGAQTQEESIVDRLISVEQALQELYDEERFIANGASKSFTLQNISGDNTTVVILGVYRNGLRIFNAVAAPADIDEFSVTNITITLGAIPSENEEIIVSYKYIEN